jgi:DNA-binding transcriptional ArsR family regulator
MPYRAIVSKELAGLLRVLSHPHRIRIIEELREGERDVNSIQRALSISHSGVSQHLMQLRAHRLVAERREGRRVLYHLLNAGLARWLAEAMRFLEEEHIEAGELRKAIRKTRAVWISS